MLDRSGWLERLVVAAAVLLIVWGIGSFGFWDPWELALAEAAPWPFGVNEFWGRLPGVVAGLFTCALAFWLLSATLRARAGVIAAAVLASAPLFLLNARLMNGAWAGIALQAWVGVAAIAAWRGARSRGRTIALHALLALGVGLSAWVSGVLLGPFPPLLAVAALSVLSDAQPGSPNVGRWWFPALASALVAGVVRAIMFDSPETSAWLGGGAVGGDPPAYGAVLELIVHGFAPWSAALPVAAIWVLAPRPERSDATQRLAWSLLLWATFACVAWTVFASRYGTPPFLALLPLAGLIGIWLTEVCDQPHTRWPAAVVVALLLGLIIRDYALYPDSAIRGLAVDGLSLPEVYAPSAGWALVFSIAGVSLVLTLVSHGAVARPEPQRVVEWLRTQSQSGSAARVWILVATLLLGACLAFGAMALFFDLPIPSVAARIGRVAFFVPIALVALVFALPWLQFAWGRLRERRYLPALAGALTVGAFVSLSFQPTLSQHFSPKPVYEAYASLAKTEAEPLAAYRLSPTAARFYTNARVREIGTQGKLLSFLVGGEQRWAVIPAEQLPELNRAHRRNTGEHLYVADAQSARLLLLAARPIDGHANRSFIAHAVLKEAPSVQHPVGANYGDVLELIGYDLELPGGDSVGAGQRFTVTWYWRVTGKAPSGYQVFVHIDGYGLRINGDHVPVEGRYPMSLWEEGDVVVDRQSIRVPPNFRSGDHPIYVGVFKGSKRLAIRSGPNDGDDRLQAGTLRVR